MQHIFISNFKAFFRNAKSWSNPSIFKFLLLLCDCVVLYPVCKVRRLECFTASFSFELSLKLHIDSFDSFLISRITVGRSYIREETGRALKGWSNRGLHFHSPSQPYWPFVNCQLSIVGWN